MVDRKAGTFLDNIESKKHKVIVTGRSHAQISGVQDVNEFDSNQIDLITNQGKMIIKGKELKVKGLNIEKGDVDIEGKIDSFVYSTKQTEESLVKKLFS